VGGGESSN